MLITVCDSQLVERKNNNYHFATVQKAQRLSPACLPHFFFYQIGTKVFFFPLLLLSIAAESITQSNKRGMYALSMTELSPPTKLSAYTLITNWLQYGCDVFIKRGLKGGAIKNTKRGIKVTLEGVIMPFCSPLPTHLG